MHREQLCRAFQKGVEESGNRSLVFCPHALGKPPIEDVSRTLKGRIPATPTGLERLTSQLGTTPDFRIAPNSADVSELLQTQDLLLTPETKRHLILTELEAMHKRYQEKGFCIGIQDFDIENDPGGIQDIITMIEVVCLKHDISFDKEISLEEALEAVFQHGRISQSEKEELIKNYSGLCQANTKYGEAFYDFEAAKLITWDACQHKEIISGLVIRIINRSLFDRSLLKSRSYEIEGRGDVRNHYGVRGGYLYFSRYSGLQRASDGVAISIVEWGKSEPPSAVQALEIVKESVEESLCLSDELRTLIRGLPEEACHPKDFFRIFWKDIDPNHPASFIYLPHIFRVMHDLGLLEKFNPEFKEARYLRQAGTQHLHTVVDHMLDVLDKVVDLVAGEEKLFGEVGVGLRPLLLSAVTHDLGKVRVEGRGHAEAGGPIIEGVAKRLGLPPREVEMTAKLGAMHMRLSRYYDDMNVDTKDEEVIMQFRDEVEDLGFLGLLAVLSYADYYSIPDPGGITQREGFLAFVREFCYDVLLALQSERSLFSSRRLKGVLARKLPGVVEDLRLEKKEVSRVRFPFFKALAHFFLLKDNARYFSQSEQVISEDISLIWELKRKRGKYIIHDVHHPSRVVRRPYATGAGKAKRENRRIRIFKIIAEDRSDVLWKLAGAFSEAGLDVVNFQIYSRKWNILGLKRLAVYKFFIVDGQRKEILAGTCDDFKEKTAKLFMLDLEDAEEEFETAKTRVGVLKQREKPRVIFNNGRSRKFTCLQVTGIDRLFLLYDITRVIGKYCRIHHAHAAAEKEKGGNVFYVLGKDGKKIEDSVLKSRITNELEQRLTV